MYGIKCLIEIVFLIFANICYVYTQEFHCMPLMQVTFHLQWVQVIALLIHCFSHTQFSLINENSFSFIFAITCRVKRLIFFCFCLSLALVLSGASLWHNYRMWPVFKLPKIKKHFAFVSQMQESLDLSLETRLSSLKTLVCLLRQNSLLVRG